MLQREFLLRGAIPDLLRERLLSDGGTYLLSARLLRIRLPLLRDRMLPGLNRVAAAAT
jgi:hypothetical protein